MQYKCANLIIYHYLSYTICQQFPSKPNSYNTWIQTHLDDQAYKEQNSGCFDSFNLELILILYKLVKTSISLLPFISVNKEIRDAFIVEACLIYLLSRGLYMWRGGIYMWRSVVCICGEAWFYMQRGVVCIFVEAWFVYVQRRGLYIQRGVVYICREAWFVCVKRRGLYIQRGVVYICGEAWFVYVQRCGLYTWAGIEQILR